MGSFLLDSTWFLSTRTLSLLMYLFPDVPFTVWLIGAAFICFQQKLGVHDYGPRGN